jgi:virginiamycin A acetyltransferase
MLSRLTVLSEVMAKLENGARIISSDYIEGKLTVDQHSCISRSTLGKYIAVGCYSLISRSDLGSFVTIASRCSVGAFNHPTDWLSVCEFQYRDTAYMFNGESLSPGSTFDVPSSQVRTQIGSDVWIGDNAVVLQGVTIGDGAIIGAGSVVTKDVDSFSIVVGNPARHLRYRFPEHIRTQLSLIKWWQFDICDLDNVRFDQIDVALSDLREIQAHKIINKNIP